MVSAARPFTFSLLILGISTYLSASPPAKIKSLRFTGNEQISASRLLSVMLSREGEAFSPPQLTEDSIAVIGVYREEGYFFAAVGIDKRFLDDSASVNIVLNISEGPRLPLAEIDVRGCAVLSAEQILEHFETRPGTFLRRQTLESDIEGLLSRYERMGYPFAQVTVADVSSISRDGTAGLSLVLDVDEGQRVTIDEIQVRGNTETNAGVIVRETGLKLHELYDQERIDRIRARLNRMDIFASVQDPQLYLRGRTGGLLIGVTEGNTNTFDGIVGYLPATGGGTVTGMVDVSMRNLFGTARKLGVRWQREDANTQEISLRYLEPWVLGLPANIGGGIDQRQQDTLYVRRVLDARADLLLSEELSIGGLFTHESVIPSAGVRTAFLSNSRTITTGLEIHYDTRDDLLSPTGGINYRSGYQIGNKKVYGSTTVPGGSVQKVSVDAEFYVGTFSRQVTLVGLHGREISSPSIELGDLYRFGGTNTLRGYRENQFLGSRIAWTNAEYRFLMTRRSFFYGFFDTGYYFLPANDATSTPSSQGTKYGYGIGVRLETSLGNVGVSFALGEGDSFGEGKIHIGLVNEF